MSALSQSITNLRIIRLCMLFAVAVYFGVIVQFPAPSHARGLGRIEVGVVLLALWCANSVFFFNRKYVRKSEDLLKHQPDDSKAARRWQVGYIIIYALSFAITGWGTVLHFFGSPVTHVVPFFAVSAVLLAWFRPRIPSGAAG